MERIETGGGVRGWNRGWREGGDGGMGWRQVEEGGNGKWASQFALNIK